MRLSAGDKVRVIGGSGKIYTAHGIMDCKREGKDVTVTRIGVRNMDGVFFCEKKTTELEVVKS